MEARHSGPPETAANRLDFHNTVHGRTLQHNPPRRFKRIVLIAASAVKGNASRSSRREASPLREKLPSLHPCNPTGGDSDASSPVHSDLLVRPAANLLNPIIEHRDSPL
jgi:hypothetical protein